MSTKYRNIFAANDMIVHYRHRKDGVYEARFHRRGIDVEVSSKNLKLLKEKFIEKLNLKGNEPMPFKPREVTHEVVVPVKTRTFSEYACEWLSVKKATTKPSTYKEYVRLIEHDILPEFENATLMQSSVANCRNFYSVMRKEALCARRINYGLYCVVFSIP